jgi:hypothetical protein
VRQHFTAKGAASRSRRAASAPGRIHHCNTIASLKKPLRRWTRLQSRVAFGKPIYKPPSGWHGESADNEMTTCFAQGCGHDKVGNEAAALEIAR